MDSDATPASTNCPLSQVLQQPRRLQYAAGYPEPLPRQLLCNCQTGPLTVQHETVRRSDSQVLPRSFHLSKQFRAGASRFLARQPSIEAAKLRLVTEAGFVDHAIAAAITRITAGPPSGLIAPVRPSCCTGTTTGPTPLTGGCCAFCIWLFLSKVQPRCLAASFADALTVWRFCAAHQTARMGRGGAVGGTEVPDALRRLPGVHRAPAGAARLRLHMPTRVLLSCEQGCMPSVKLLRASSRELSATLASATLAKMTSLLHAEPTRTAALRGAKAVFHLLCSNLVALALALAAALNAVRSGASSCVLSKWGQQIEEPCSSPS